MTDSDRIAHLQTVLPGWFGRHGRPLPWRESYDPYAVWIAEVMMQQTQMDRGVQYFARWMELFPDVTSVAEAADDALLMAWEGLGYYSRVRNLKAAARAILERHAGGIPADPIALQALPGIGPYTAGAIASTAFNISVPCVDGNVERVLARVFDLDSPVKAEPAKSRIRELATALIPEGQARQFNQSLMELGALVCRKKPDCQACPLPAVHPALCESRHLGVVDDRPVPGRRATVTPVEVANGVLLRGGRVFVQRREDEGVWAGLWEFPGGCMEPGEIPEQTVVREWGEELDFAVRPVRKLAVIRHSYTTYRVTLHCYILALDAPPADPFPAPPALREATDWRWVTFDELAALPLPAPHRKIADMLEHVNIEMLGSE